MVHPASAVMVNRAGSTDTIRFMRVVDRRIDWRPSVGTEPPDNEVCPPWLTMATPADAQARTTACTTSTESGRATSSGVPENSPR